MSIKKFFAEKDNTITNAFKANLTNRGTTANMGASDIMEVYSIYAQATTESLEKSRMLVHVPVNKIATQRSSGHIPATNRVNFILKLHNAEHGDTTPSDYTLALSPLLQDWSEGHGLDMESFSDTGASNWLSSSTNNLWTDAGSTFAKRAKMNSKTIPAEYTQYFKTGLENLEVDITGLVEGWITDHNNLSKHATASIDFTGIGQSFSGEKLQLHSTTGDSEIYQFSTKSVSELGVNYVLADADGDTQATNLVTAITNFSSNFSAQVGAGADSAKVFIYQEKPGFFGNTLVSSSSGVTFTVNHFSSGEGVKNYGVVVRMSGSAEDGTSERSYYTKKFFTRTSSNILKRPGIEARFDTSIADDRGSIVEKSDLAPSSENLNKIFFYNRTRGGALNDIPNTGSELLVQLYENSDGTGDPVVLPVGGGVQSHSTTFITASRHSKGIYSAQFSCTGSGDTLYDVWKKDDFTEAVSPVQANANINVTGFPVSGETFTVQDTSGTSATFIFVGGVNTSDGSKDGSSRIIIGLAALADSDALIDRMVLVFNNQTDIAVTAAHTDSKLRLTQDVAGAAGNTTLDLSGVTNMAHNGDNTGFHDGVTEVVESHTYTSLVTGSGFTINPYAYSSYYKEEDYVCNITNLKKSYRSDETATFRIYTRNKKWQPNIYTVATNNAPVDNVREGFYKVKRVIDDYEVIRYSTSSATSYSKLSYDLSGSFFDLDMSILEPNYLYEISLLFKQNNDFVEQSEKFRFRVK